MKMMAGERRARKIVSIMDRHIRSEITPIYLIEIKVAIIMDDIRSMVRDAMREVDAILGIKEPF